MSGSPAPGSEILAPEYRKVFTFLTALMAIIGTLYMGLSAAEARMASVAQKTLEPTLAEQKSNVMALQARMSDSEKRIDRAEMAQQRMMDVLTEIRGDVKYLKEKAGAR